MLIFSFIKNLYKVSQRRGSQASGLSVWDILDNKIHVYKSIGSPEFLFNNLKINELLNNKLISGSPVIFLGHSRMQTDGDYNNNLNNQPVINDNSILIHNGIVCNYKELNHNYNSTFFHLEKTI